MAGQVQIDYGGFTFGSGTPPTYPTPYLATSKEMVYLSKKWCQVTQISLDGVIEGDYATLTAKRDAIINAFNSDFQTLTITEFSTTGGSNYTDTFSNCIIRSISFSDMDNFGLVTYTISITCYESSDFNGTFGVLNPVNEWSFSEGEDSFITINRKISAQGFKTSNLPITNAKNFVEGLAGTSTLCNVGTAFIGGYTGAGCNTSDLVLLSSGVNINRIDSSYELNESYIVQTGKVMDISPIQGVTSNFSVDLSSGINDEFVTVNVDYSIQGGKNMSASTLRSKIPPSGTLYKIATGATMVADLNITPLNFSVEDDVLNSHTISVKSSYNNDKTFSGFSQNVYFDYQTSLDMDQVTDVVTVSVNGEIRANGRNFNDKVNKVSGYYYDSVLGTYNGNVTGFLYDIANKSYTTAGMGVPTDGLGKNPNSISVSDNLRKGSISMSASFTDADQKEGFKEASFSIEGKPALWQYNAKPSANRNGLYQIFNLNVLTRENITINGSLAAYDNPSNAIIDVKGLPKYESHVADFINLLGNTYVYYNLNINDVIVTSESAGREKGPKFSTNFNHAYDYDTKKEFALVPFSFYGGALVMFRPVPIPP